MGGWGEEVKKGQNATSRGMAVRCRGEGSEFFFVVEKKKGDGDLGLGTCGGKKKGGRGEGALSRSHARTMESTPGPVCLSLKFSSANFMP